MCTREDSSTRTLGVESPEAEPGTSSLKPPSSLAEEAVPIRLSPALEELEDERTDRIRAHAETNRCHRSFSWRPERGQPSRAALLIGGGALAMIVAVAVCVLGSTSSGSSPSITRVRATGKPISGPAPPSRPPRAVAKRSAGERASARRRAAIRAKRKAARRQARERQTSAAQKRASEGKTNDRRSEIDPPEPVNEERAESSFVESGSASAPTTSTPSPEPSPAQEAEREFSFEQQR